MLDEAYVMNDGFHRPDYIIEGEGTNDKEIINGIEAALLEGNDRFKCVAARVLGRMKTRVVVAPLLMLLDDPDPDVRCDAAIALGEVKERVVVPALVKLLEDEDGQSVLCAIDALADIGDASAVAPLVQTMTSNRSLPIILGDLSGDYGWEFRERAVQALGKLGDHEAVKALIDALKDDDSEMMIGSLFLSLVQLGTPEGLTTVASYLKDPDVGVRRKAAGALRGTTCGTAIESLSEALLDGDSVVRVNAVEAIGNTGGEKEIVPLVLLLADRDSDVKKKAAEVICKLGKGKAVKYISALLADPDGDVRRKTVELLGEIGNKECIEPVINALEDKDETVCNAAVLSLGKMREKTAVLPLIAILKEKNRPSGMRQCAIDGLSRIGGDYVFQALRELVQDKEENGRLRRTAMRMLSNIDEEAAVDVAASSLNSTDDFLKKEAALSMAHRGNDSGLDILAPLIKGEDHNSVSEICDAIRNIKSEKAMSLLTVCLMSDDEYVRLAAVRAVGQAGNKGIVPLVIDLLNDESKEVRREAAVALGNLQDKRALEPLISSLFDYERSNGHMQVVVVSLKKIDEGKTVSMLLDVLKDKENKDCWCTAIEALADMSGEAANA